MPDRHRNDRGNAEKIVIGCQHQQFMTNAQLRQQSIDCSNLNTLATAGIPQFGGMNMVVPVWNQQWQCCKVLDDLFVCFWFRETLQEFLQHQPGTENAA